MQRRRLGELVADTGWVIAGTGTNNAAVGNKDWHNPGNITADDGSVANGDDVDSGQTTHWLEADDFGFSIPAGAAIDGVRVRVQKDAKWDDNTTDHTVQLLVAGTASGDNKADTVTLWTTTPTNYNYGDSSNLWGLSLDPDDVNHADFGVGFRSQSSAKNAEQYVDAIWIKVWYTEAAASSTGGGVMWFMRDSMKKLLWLPKRRKLWAPETVL